MDSCFAFVVWVRAMDSLSFVWCSREDRSNLPAGIRDDDVTLGPSSTLSPHHLCTERWGERGEEAWKDAIII
jgi:hypothetical protein